MEIAGGGMGQMRQRLLGRRVDDVLTAAAVAVIPLAVDVEPVLRGHGVSSLKIFVENRVVPAGHVPKGAFPLIDRRDWGPGEDVCGVLAPPRRTTSELQPMGEATEARPRPKM